MTLSATTLGYELKAMGLFDNEPESIAAWAAAYSTYFEDATANETSIVPDVLVAAELAMKLAMTGLSITGAAAIQSGAVAFWGSLSLVFAAAWPGSIAIVPPALLSGMGAALQVVFTANTAGSLSKDASMSAIATSIHTNSLGGSVTYPGPVSFPII